MIGNFLMITVFLEYSLTLANINKNTSPVDIPEDILAVRSLSLIKYIFGEKHKKWWSYFGFEKSFNSKISFFINFSLIYLLNVYFNNLVEFSMNICLKIRNAYMRFDIFKNSKIQNPPQMINYKVNNNIKKMK